jgi:tetratricopeptide (TPR) repeat protein
MHAWWYVIKLQRALGRPQQALALTKKGIAVLDGSSELTAMQRWRRAELQHEAALSAHLLGDIEEAIAWLKRCTRKLPKGWYLSSQQEALLLLDILSIDAGKGGSLRRTATRAQGILQRATRHPLAAAALAVVAYRQGDAEAMTKWVEVADRLARSMIGNPFCHDDWQQTQAILRRIRG